VTTTARPPREGERVLLTTEQMFALILDRLARIEAALLRQQQKEPEPKPRYYVGQGKPVAAPVKASSPTTEDGTHGTTAAATGKRRKH
jgi:hypothetical protein